MALEAPVEREKKEGGNEEAVYFFLIMLIYFRFFCIGCCLQMG